MNACTKNLHFLFDNYPSAMILSKCSRILTRRDKGERGNLAGSVLLWMILAFYRSLNGPAPH